MYHGVMIEIAYGLPLYPSTTIWALSDFNASHKIGHHFLTNHVFGLKFQNTSLIYIANTHNKHKTDFMRTTLY